MGVESKVNPNVEAEEAGGETQSKKAAKKLAKETAKAAKVQSTKLLMKSNRKMFQLFDFRKLNIKQLPLALALKVVPII